MAPSELSSLLDLFISGADISLSLANKLEVLIDDEFPEDDYFQETVEMLACYRPEGGASVLGVEAIRRRLIDTKEHLQAGNNSSNNSNNRGQTTVSC